MQIAANILEIAKDGSRKTRIMYLGNLSFDLLEKYLDVLTRSGLLRFQERARSYVVTEKGRRFLEEFYEVQRYLEEFEAKRGKLERHLTPPNPVRPSRRRLVVKTL